MQAGYARAAEALHALRDSLEELHEVEHAIAADKDGEFMQKLSTQLEQARLHARHLPQRAHRHLRAIAKAND